MESLEDIFKLCSEFFEKIITIISPTALKEEISKKCEIFIHLMKLDKSQKMLKEYISSLNKPSESVMTLLVEEFLHKSKFSHLENPSKSDQSEMKKLVNSELSKIRKDRVHSIDVQNTMSFGLNEKKKPFERSSQIAFNDILKTETSSQEITHQFSYKESPSGLNLHNKSESLFPQAFRLSLPAMQNINEVHFSVLNEGVASFFKELKANTVRIEEWMKVVNDNPILPIKKKPQIKTVGFKKEEIFHKSFERPTQPSPINLVQKSKFQGTNFLGDFLSIKQPQFEPVQPQKNTFSLQARNLPFQNGGKSQSFNAMFQFPNKKRV